MISLQKSFSYHGEKILPECDVDQGSKEPEPTQESTDEFTSLLQRLGPDLTEDEVTDWLGSDEHDIGYAHLTDEEIISDIVQESTQDESEDSDTDEGTEEVSKVTHSSAVKLFDATRIRRSMYVQH